MILRKGAIKNLESSTKGTTDDAIQALLQRELINGILPQNDDTDNFLSKLSGGAFDFKNENQKNELMKQLSKKLTSGQMTCLTSHPDLLQTMIFVLFFIKFVSKQLQQKHKKRLNKSMDLLQKKLAEPQLPMTDFEDLASIL